VLVTLAVSTSVGQAAPTPACTRTITGTVRGAIIVRRGQTVCIVNARVVGSVLVLPGGGLSVTNSTVVGSIFTNGATFVTICGPSTSPYAPAVRTAFGSVSIVGTTGRVTIGGAPGSGCAPNQIGGALILRNNRGGTTAFGNTVGGSTSATSNLNGLLIGANSINGSLSCHFNVPPPTNGGVANNVVGAKTGQCAGL
jgi:hypothetical protein